MSPFRSLLTPSQFRQPLFFFVEIQPDPPSSGLPPSIYEHMARGIPTLPPRFNIRIMKSCWALKEDRCDGSRAVNRKTRVLRDGGREYFSSNHPFQFKIFPFPPSPSSSYFTDCSIRMGKTMLRFMNTLRVNERFKLCFCVDLVVLCKHMKRSSRATLSALVNPTYGANIARVIASSSFVPEEKAPFRRRMKTNLGKFVRILASLLPRSLRILY